MEEDKLDLLRRCLDAHAEEIALCCRSAPPGTLCLAQMGHDGAWLGAMPVSESRPLPPEVAGQGLGFYFPPRCQTADAVRAVVWEQLGENGDPA